MNKILLLWSENIGSFVKEEVSKVLSREDRILVLGTEIKMEDYKKLDALQVPFSMEPIFAAKEDCEVFLLGGLKEKEFISYTPLSKKAKDIAAKLELPVSDFKQLTKAPVKRKRTTVPKESPEEIGKTEKSKKESPAPKPELKKNKGMDIKSLLSNAKLNQFTSPGTIALIEEAVKRAADTDTFRFQLKMVLGESSEKVSNVLVPLYEKLKEDTNGKVQYNPAGKA